MIHSLDWIALEFLYLYTTVCSSRLSDTFMQLVALEFIVLIYHSLLLIGFGGHELLNWLSVSLLMLPG